MAMELIVRRKHHVVIARGVANFGRDVRTLTMTKLKWPIWPIIKMNRLNRAHVLPLCHLSVLSGDLQ